MRHKLIASIRAALIALGLGLGIWGATSVLPHPANAIPEPQLGHFAMCSILMWLHTQDRSVRWLGDCVGQLYSPPAEMRLNQGTVFAIGCLPGECPELLRLSSAAGRVVSPQGKHGSAYYFKAVGNGAAVIWAIFRNGLGCSLTNGVQPKRCPAIRLVVGEQSVKVTTLQKLGVGLLCEHWSQSS